MQPVDRIDSFDEYQKLASATSQYKKLPDPNGMIVSLFGIGSEMGTLHDIAKKQFRNNMKGLSDRRVDVMEEIGDLLWYVAILAKSFNVRLSDVARLNLEKTSDLHGKGVSSSLGIRGIACERFPERMLFEFRERKVKGVPMAKMTLIAVTPNDFPAGPIMGYLGSSKQQGFVLGPVGAEVDDNSRRSNGYRYHDAIHLAFMTHLGWSPTLRNLLRVKRKSEPAVDRNEDGARAIFKDEAIATVVAELSKNRDDFATTMHVDSDVVTVIRDVATGHEVAELPRVAWKPAICDGIDKMRSLEKHKGGIIGCDLIKQNMLYWPPGDPSSINEKLKQLRSTRKPKSP